MKDNFWIDPPSGWRYGFPKLVKKGTEINRDWFVANGYPEWLYDSFKDRFPVRYWEDIVDSEVGGTALPNGGMFKMEEGGMADEQT